LINSEEFKNNYENMKILIEDLQKELKKSLFQGSEKSIEKHLKAGKLLARDLIELILDEDSPFLEICPLAGWGQRGIDVGGSIVAGIGLVCETECMITYN
jgi:acetyl-CoA carboxylase carboxyltransferase component